MACWRYGSAGADVPGANASTDADGWFMIADGADPRTPGCWEVTATYEGAILTYVYFVPDPD